MDCYKWQNKFKEYISTIDNFYCIILIAPDGYGKTTIGNELNAIIYEGFENTTGNLKHLYKLVKKNNIIINVSYEKEKDILSENWIKLGDKVYCKKVF
jgi:predicted ATP-binding protein involved in virulence